MSDPLPKLSQREKDTLEGIFAKPLGYPRGFISWLEQYLTINPPAIPITQFKGFALHGQDAYVAAAESLVYPDTGFVDLTTDGPTISDQPNGQYLFLYGALIESGGPGNTDCEVAVFANGAQVSGSISGRATQAIPIAGISYATLSDTDDRNEVKLKYAPTGIANDGTDARFSRRWLVSLRVG